MEKQNTQEEKLMTYEGTLRAIVDSCTVDVDLELGFGIVITKRLKLWGLMQSKDKSKQSAAIALIKKSLDDSMISIHFQEDPTPHQGPYFVTISFIRENTKAIKMEEIFINELLLDQKLVTEYIS